MRPAIRLLERARFYDFSQRLAGKANVYRVFVGDYLRPRDGDRLLDLACGTGELLRYLPDVAYVGIDLNADYLHAARQRHAVRADFVHADLTDCAVHREPFDLVVALGVLHHLDDDRARTVVALARRSLAAGGRFVLLEPCRRHRQPFAAKAVIAMDRGEHVRDYGGYHRLLQDQFEEVRGTLREDLLWMPSTQVVFECRGAH
jgi:SAM-dependent methyltransferase